jgi:hypothetical protein
VQSTFGFCRPTVVLRLTKEANAQKTKKMEDKIEIYKTATGTEVSVQLEKDSVWIDAPTIAQVFGVNRPAIVKHVGNIYKSGELETPATKITRSRIPKNRLAYRQPCH